MGSRDIARIAACVALLAVASWVSIPLGPVPFTLQTMALAMVPVVLDGRGAVWAVAIYLLLGGVGLPVFSNMSGGIAALAGPTGGFLWGFLLGMMVSTVIRDKGEALGHARWPLALAALLLVSYLAGTIQFTIVSGSDVMTGLVMCVLPFIVPDVVKLACGLALGRAVRRALSASSASMV